MSSVPWRVPLISGPQLGSGVMWTYSGIDSGYPYPRRCTGCGQVMGLSLTLADNLVVRGVSGLAEVWCWKCAGYSYEKRRFKNLEDYIRESLPHLKDMPSPILADYLEENGASAAEWIRNHTSGG